MKSSVKALTLVELVVTLSVAGILMASATSFGNYIEKTKAHSDIKQLRRVLSYARNLATLEKQNIVLCPLDTTGSCQRTWNQELTLFSDRNRDQKLDPLEDIHTRIKSLSPEVAKRNFQRAALIYFPTGFSTTGTLSYCAKTQPLVSYAFILSRVGRTRPGQDKNNNGITENASNKDIPCPK